MAVVDTSREVTVEEIKGFLACPQRLHLFPYSLGCWTHESVTEICSVLDRILPTGKQPYPSEDVISTDHARRTVYAGDGPSDGNEIVLSTRPNLADYGLIPKPKGYTDGVADSVTADENPPLIESRWKVGGEPTEVLTTNGLLICVIVGGDDQSDTLAKHIVEAHNYLTMQTEKAQP